MKTQDTMIDLGNFMSSISLALDLATSSAYADKNQVVDLELDIPDFNRFNHDFTMHSKRVALISLYISGKLGITGERLHSIYFSSLLHDIGVIETNIGNSEGRFLVKHSDSGSALLEKMPFDKDISYFIKMHHENYDGTGPYGLRGSEIPLEVCIIHAADVLDLASKAHITNVQERNATIKWLKSKKGILFAPDIIDAISELSETERFWLDMANISKDSSVLDRITPKIYRPLSMGIIENMARIFAVLIDSKSKFTHDHSNGITEIADKLSLYLGFKEQKRSKLHIAALMHDLGKLSIPNDILDKPGPLNNHEFSLIRSHTYYTKLILSKITGFSEIADWAGNHHENLLGSGYPEQIKGAKLSLESRIVTVSDIYHALVEDRPYRTSMSKEAALVIIDGMVSDGRLDKKVVKALKEVL